MASPLTAFGRILGLAGVSLVIAPLQAVLMKLKSPVAKRLPQTYHRWCRKMMGVTVLVKGKQLKTGPVLFVANHTSYLDIVLLGSVLEGASFVSKADVRHWPVIGWLSTLQRTVYIDRRRSQAGSHKSMLQQRLEDKESLILFPEGTSSDGNRTLPFKSALFSVAEEKVNGAYVTVQPVSVAYTHLDGMPLDYHLRPHFGWYGDMAMGPHIWTLLGMGRLTVQIELHDPVDMEAFGSRKAMAEYCHKVVATGVSNALNGRQHPKPVMPVGGAGPMPVRS